MGNRVLIQFYTDGSVRDPWSKRKVAPEVSPVIYGHWFGSEAAVTLIALREQMKPRGADVSYIAARMVGLMCHASGLTRDTGVGMWNAKGRGKAALLKSEDSHGDAGIFLVNVSRPDWVVTMIGGHDCERGAVRTLHCKAVQFVDGDAP